MNALAKKLGMTRIKQGQKMIPVTMLYLENCKVLGSKEYANHKSNILCIGKVKNVNKAQQNLPYAVVKEFVTDTLLDADTLIKADAFTLGSYINVTGTSKGKGFQGGMKRHGFHGLRATHGVSVSHRSLGSTGNRTEPGRVFPGKKMPGRMGGDRVTTKRLQVVYSSLEHNVIGVHGCVPGCTNGHIEIRDSKY